MRIPETPPDLHRQLGELTGPRMLRIAQASWGPAPGGRYRHWETLRHVPPPDGFTIEEYWIGQRLARLLCQREVPGMTDRSSRPFTYGLPDPVMEMLHAVDVRLAGPMSIPGPVVGVENQRRYLIRGLMEEAITSSQLEGAATTRSIARDMLRTGRAPRNASERMILNNYQAMQRISSLRERELTIRLIEELHTVLTEATAPDAVTYRRPGDGIGVYDNATNKLLFEPPDAGETRARLAAMCSFANSMGSGPYLHPVVRAIILHFWFAYIHPFTDGNGRTARAIFYWSLLRQGYCMVEYISISRILKGAPARYGRSFLYTETDSNDLTYFILSQLAVLLRAADDLETYLARKARQLREVVPHLTPASDLNPRQIALLSHALRHPDQVYTIGSHRNSHGVTYQTARTDVLSLAERGLLVKAKQGKRFVFTPRKDLEERIRRL